MGGGVGFAGSSVLRIGVVTAFPSEDWHSARLIAAVGEQGAKAVVIDPATFALDLNGQGLDVTTGAKSVMDLDALLLARGLSPRGDGDLQFEAYHQLVGLGQPQVNCIGALLTAQDKLRASCLFARAGVPTPETRMVQTEHEALAALADLRWAVVKPRFGSLGNGMVRLRADSRGRAHLRGLLEKEGGLYLQRFVATGGEDYRVFVVAGRAVAAVRRRARGREWRTNLAQGGMAKAFEPPIRLARTAVAAARAVGLAYTAVDVVATSRGYFVLEVNGHPNFEMAWESCRVDVGERIVAHVLQRARGWRRRFERAARGKKPQGSLGRDNRRSGWAAAPVA